VIDAYKPLSALGQKYGGATDLYLDALGVNGAGGADRAKSAFTVGPGYQFQQDEAAKIAANKAASLGIAGSGNTLQAISDRAQNIANTEYGSYLDRLASFVNPELSATSGAASGIASGYKSLADLYYGQGRDIAGAYGTNANQVGSVEAARAGLADTDAARRAAILGETGAARTKIAADVAGGQANALGQRINVLGNVTGGQASANNQVAQAAQNGSATFWNGLFSLAGNAARGFGGGPSNPKPR
jgi:hypothetical protein